MSEKVEISWLERPIMRMQVQPMIIGMMMLADQERIQVTSKLPADTKMVGWYPDQARDSIWLIFESNEFDPVPECGIIPELPFDTVTFHHIRLCEGEQTY
jgi:hypothetical protein